MELIRVLPGSTIRGFDNASNVNLSVKVDYIFGNNNYGNRTVFRRDEDRLFEAQDSLVHSEHADLACLAWEAWRIRNSHLFDPYQAAFASNIELLPHQIEAVYDKMLGQHPLRFLLADDPGAGKTIMAGLFVREMMARDVVGRCLIVVPGNLSEQWRIELRDKFNIDFEIVSREMILRGNPFAERPRLIARMDQLKRIEYRELVEESRWDLIICDEAHKMSATYSGGEISRTQRYMLGEKLSGITRHFLLMTATPHNGNEPDYQLFLRLLDDDRFEGRFRAGVRRFDTSDVVLRRMKEQLVTFDGRPLFPERKSYTANYGLSDQERLLYKAVTDYCRNEFNRAQHLEGGRRNTVGFALIVLQRRLASSPEAIYQSLRSRRQRLEELLEDWYNREPVVYADFDEEDVEELTAEEREKKEDEANDLATAALDPFELEREIGTLQYLESQADELRSSDRDSKWEKLREIWERRLPEMEQDGQPRKLIIFTEHRATLRYLVDKLGNLLGDSNAIVTIHGGIRQEERRIIQDRFRDNSRIQILVATDAAGEGINLQFAHLMVNYDLPWNPNRLEQRFGRIHRIGQTEVCHLWNIVTRETREGSVYERLLQKLETIGNALNGKVFDILGELFVGEPLPNLLREALRYGDNPQVRDRLNQVIDNAVNPERIHELAQGRVLASDVIDVSLLRASIEDADVRRLSTRNIRDFLLRVFDHLSIDYSSRVGGEILELENGFYRFSRVPGVIVEHARRLGMRDIRAEYERVSFDPVPVRIATRFDAPEHVGPGHSLLEATIRWVSSHWEKSNPECGEALPVLVDENEKASNLRVLFHLQWSIHNALLMNNLIEQRALLVQVDDGHAVSQIDSGRYLTFRAATAEETAHIVNLLGQDWHKDQTFADLATAFTTAQLVQLHRDEVERREIRRRETEQQQVQASLEAEITYEQSLVNRYRLQDNPGLRVQAERRQQDLEERLDRRLRQIALQSQISPSSITVRRVAVVVPVRLLCQ